jgi:hypothetical protein
MIYCFDIEVYKNFFCVTFKNVDTGEISYFELSQQRDDLDKILEFIGDNKKWLIGYNNFEYDNQLLNYIYKYKFITVQQLAELSNNIIKNDFREYKYNLPFKSLDLMRVGALFQKSLKMCAVNLNWLLIQDLPYNEESIITVEQVETVKKYNLNDVEITEALYKFLLPEIKLRKEITLEFNVDVMNESDSGVANKLLSKFYSDLTGLEYKQFKDLRTPRDYIHLSEVVFDNIRFQTPELKHFLDKLKSFVLINGKTYFKKSVIFKGLKLVYGVGGIHSDDQPKLFKEDDDNLIIDCDIGSFYPKIIANHNLCPEHLDKRFINMYKQLIPKRIQAKKNKDVAKAEGLKTVLNSTFGKTGLEHHWLYDPMIMYNITVNGQLYITMLIEQLMINNFEVISCNTDGITCKVKRSRLQEYKDICEKWSKQTKFELEYKNYKIYARRDVNNYLALVDGKLDEFNPKEKGDFITTNLTKTNNVKLKGVDKKIIAIALREYFVNNKPIIDTIKNHINIYDFCTAIRSDNKFSNEYHHIVNGKLQIDTLQKTNRFYVSNSGGSLFKIDKKENKVINYCAGKNVIIFNKFIQYPKISNYNINYNYYITETQKIIDLIIPKQLTLW